MTDVTFPDDALAEAELQKYSTMWADPDYRLVAPGEPLVAEAIQAMGMDPVREELVIDFGCGTGRPAEAFMAAGFQCTGVDLTEDCLDEGVDLDAFVAATLWRLPPPNELFAHWGFCTDVMEHLPPGKVEPALREIRARTWRGVFFQIACFPDTRAKHGGLELHLTVREPGWWAELLRTIWPAVVVRPNGDRPQFCCMTGETNPFAEQAPMECSPE